MKLTFLGTGAGTPSRTRNLAGIALQWMQQGAVWLFDCGEGTQQQILRSPLSLSRIQRIFITHMHGDHVFGLPGLLSTRSMIDSTAAPITLHGPEELERFVTEALDATHANLRYPLTYETISEGRVFEDEACEVFCRRLEHGAMPSYGYAIQEKPRAGAFDAEQAASLGVPEGPLYGRLKAGETVTLPDGRTVDGTRLVGPAQPGRKVVICGDTRACGATVELAQGADILVHEATYATDLSERASEQGHSTSAIAAEAARAAGVKTLILTHVSARYDAEDKAGLSQLLAEAQAVFPNTLLAEDLWTYEVPAP